MIGALLSIALGAPLNAAPVDDRLLAAASVVVSAMPGLSDRHGRLTVEGRLTVLRTVYLAEMIHVGEHGEGFLGESAEATAYGPIHPRLLRACRSVVPLRENSFLPLDPAERRSVEQACELIDGLTPGQTVAMVQARDGAWDRNYVPTGDVERGPRIRIEHLAEEFAERLLPLRVEA